MEIDGYEILSRSGDEILLQTHDKQRRTNIRVRLKHNTQQIDKLSSLVGIIAAEYYRGSRH